MVVQETGELKGRQLIGPGKAEAVCAILTSQGTRAAECFAYGDDPTDVPMLEAVGHPVAVIGNPRLAEYARWKQWEVLAA